jgi:integrase
MPIQKPSGRHIVAPAIPAIPVPLMEDTQLVRLDPPQAHAPTIATLGNVDLLGAFLAGRKPTTLRAYKKDLTDFAAYLGVPGPGAAVEFLVSGTAGEANALTLGYKAHLSDRKLAPATVARRIAALRSVVKLARTLGRITWAIDIPSPRAEAYRDTRGPGLAGWKAMLAAVKKQTATPKGKRDLALLRLMHDLGMRRGEVVALDRADLDLEAGTVAVVGKGKAEKVNLTLNPPAVAALTDWVAARGDWAGPLFVRLDRPLIPGIRAGSTPGTWLGSHTASAAAPEWREARTPTGCGTRASPGPSTWPTETCERCGGSAGTPSWRRC